MKKQWLYLFAMSATTLLTTACEQLPGAVNEAKREVRRNMIDPSSAQFESVREMPQSGAVCGFVNGKNRMGAYAGANPFVYEKGKGATLVQEPPTERDFERYFETIKYAEPDEYMNMEDKCKSADLWKNKCGVAIFPSVNKYCDLINQGKSMTDVYEAAKPSLSLY